MVNVSRVETPVLNRAVAALNGGRLVEAEQLCRHIIAAKPDFFDALYLLATVQSSLGKIDAALASYDRALNVRPDAVAAHIDRGALLEKFNRHREALASFDRALSLQPTYAAAHYNRGNVLQDLGCCEEAVASYDRALALRPDLARALSNRGNALQKLKRFADAVASYDRAIALRPDFAQAFSNRGAALQELKRYDEAVASYDRAIELRPDYADALSDRGLALEALQRYDEALASYDRAFAVRPDHSEAHYAEALCRLLLGDFARGWQQNEWRWQARQLRDSQRGFAQSLWLGQYEIAGKTILLHAEQGFGDTIQFCRYVPLVAARGARVILEVQASLTVLMSSLAGTTQVVSTGSALPDFDVQCPLLSLPLAFGTRLETIPSAVPYLRAPSQSVINWDARLGPKRRPRIGLAWSGMPTHSNDHNRSLPLDSLLSLLEVDATFISLQKDVPASDALTLNQRSEILRFGSTLTDFADTAALVSNLDLVISVDTSLAHLAGALGKPVWILLPFAPDWRWLLDRDDSPWYPTARLFRQDASRLWDSVIARVHEALRGGFSA